MRSIRRFTMLVRLLFLVSTLASVSSFTPVPSSSSSNTKLSMAAATLPAHLVEPKERNAHYSDDNVAQYLVDLHDNQATFDFCGGMMFQLVLSEKLREHLLQTQNQPVIADASKRRMHNLPDYQQSADADNVHVFHGREIRKAPTAAGGMGFVLQLSLADGDDPEGWTAAEIEGYDGWAHDVGRTWRRGDVLEQEGFKDFRKKFGPDSFALHHRFYLHKDGNDRMWLSAEDGCEGTPSTGASNPLSNLFGLLG